MDISLLKLLATSFMVGCWIFLFQRAVTLGLAVRYPLAYTYFALFALAYTVQSAGAAFLGDDSAAYSRLFYAAGVPVLILSAIILLRIYFLPKPPAFKRDWPLLAVLPVFIAASMTELAPFAYRALYVGFYVLFMVGFLAASRLHYFKTVRLGQNLGGLLFGISLPACLRAFNRSLALLGGASWWTYETFLVANELTNAISWGMIAHGMSRYDPPRVVKEAAILDPKEAKDQLDRLTKALWRWPWQS